MCKPYPGPRCSTDAKKRVELYKNKLTEAETKYGVDTHEYNKVAAKLNELNKQYDATPEGIKELKERIETENDVRHLRIRLEEAEKTYAMQQNAYFEKTSGRQELIAQLAPNPENFFDEEELITVMDAAREYNERMSIRYGSEVKPATDNAYNKFLDNTEARIREENNGELPEDKAVILAQLREMRNPDTINLKTYDNLDNSFNRSREALKTQIANAAHLQNVDIYTATAFYEGYRQQYKDLYAQLPISKQPNPPKTWVNGDYGQSGYMKDFDSSFAPRDNASLYAIYRLRSDPDAIPESFKTYKDIASIDLETSGPEGKEGLKPENGRIIEVGIINYDGRTGEEKSRYSQLIKPEHLFLQKYGTGAVDVHKITVEDLEGKPDWDSVKNDVLQELEGKVLLAQNSFFEKGWLSHHGDSLLIGGLPVVDTLDISRKHLNLPNNKLVTICTEVGVAYTEGHRATHDALVTGEAYFKLRKVVTQHWRKNPTRANAPALKTIPNITRFI